MPVSTELKKRTVKPYPKLAAKCIKFSCFMLNINVNDIESLTGLSMKQ